MGYGPIVRFKVKLLKNRVVREKKPWSGEKGTHSSLFRVKVNFSFPLLVKKINISYLKKQNS